MSTPPILPTIAVLGGTGKEGKGLVYRWAKAGYPVNIGSRSAEKAMVVSAEIVQLLGGPSSVKGSTNFDAAQNADIVVLTVPYSVHRETLEGVKSALQGKILVDVTVPLVPPKITTVEMPDAGSAAQEAKLILGEGVEVAAAFHSISYEHLMGDKEIDCDVLVTGTGRDTRSQVLKLVAATGLRGWDAGPLENSVVLEGLTSVLININKLYGSKHAGIRITGVN